jgi:hypothetical protein
MSREFGDDDRSSGLLAHRNTTFTDDSEYERIASGQAVRAIGAKPDFVHTPIGLESNVASLVDSSMVDESVLDYPGDSQVSPLESSRTMDEERSRGYRSSAKASVESHHRGFDEREDTPVSGSHQSREFAEEYEVDDYGNKIPRSKDRQSPTASETAITIPAMAAAAAALRAKSKGNQVSPEDEHVEGFVPAGLERNQSFKRRAMNGPGPLSSPTHTLDRLTVDYDDLQPKLGFRAVPDMDDPMPDAVPWDDESESMHHDHLEPGQITPRQHSPHHREQPTTGDEHSKGLAMPAAVAGAAAIATAAAMAHHSRQPSQEVVDDWHRSEKDQKRDTLLTNPYDDNSRPVVNLPGVADNLLPGGDHYDGGYPMGFGTDPAYTSRQAGKMPEIATGNDQGLDIHGDDDDPFVDADNPRHLSGMSQGMASPLYDGSTGGGIDRIESKDIIALMQHLMVRDAQRSARDTEILVTIVRSAAEMRNSFEDMKRMLADQEDVIITEVKDNTERTVQRAINGPRPFPGSGNRSSYQSGGSQVGTVMTDMPKKRSFFRKALKGLSTKGTDDLGRIEDMLMQLLVEVDVLKSQTAPGAASHHGAQSMDNLQPDARYEQDHGAYEQEEHAAAAAASHAAVPVSSRASGYDRRYSDNRISTVPEDDEDDYDHVGADEAMYQTKDDMLMIPTNNMSRRGGSLPPNLPTTMPAHAVPVAQASTSHDNTPQTEKTKKHKSSSSTSWFPKISRWSETTTSSVAQVFKRSSHAPKQEEVEIRSRSGSDLCDYDDNYARTDPYGEDKLHSGFSEPDLAHPENPAIKQASAKLQGLGLQPIARHTYHQPPPPAVGRDYHAMTPEDFKYKAHRDSTNLQHPQPRAGQAENFKAALESHAHEYNSPMSPKSVDWAGSATSLNRLPPNANQVSYSMAAHRQYWTTSPGMSNVVATAGPPRPPKEPLDQPVETAKAQKMTKLQKPHYRRDSGEAGSYGMSSGGETGSPRLENRLLSGALGTPTRRPSGPRAMTPRGSTAGIEEDMTRRPKRGRPSSNPSPPAMVNIRC